MSLAVALSTIQVTVRDLARFHPNLELEHIGGSQRLPTYLTLSQTSRENLRLDDYLEYPRAAKALYIYKHLYLLRDSNPGPTALQSASLTTIQDGRQIWRYKAN
ncbi:uncharacterized protein TNCV_2097861 [Trichonephila clavipes]|nr:uncharacterized protein TNCV_2097861 [Trichonephila clavipes]